MSHHEEGQEAFWERADEVITLANQQSETADNDEVNASLLYATARFNAFLVAASADTAEELKAGKETAVAYFTEQYRNQLIEHLDEYIENFDEYNA